MESYLPTSDRHAASWIFSDGPSKPLGVVKLRYNAPKFFFYNVAILRQRACFRQILVHFHLLLMFMSHEIVTRFKIYVWSILIINSL